MITQRSHLCWPNCPTSIPSLTKLPGQFTFVWESTNMAGKKTPILCGSANTAPSSNTLCISERIWYGDHCNLVQLFCLFDRKHKHRKFVVIFLGFPGVLFYEQNILRVSPDLANLQVNEVKF